ncbi:LOW QUALITY PROTEIN: hypothetical protein CVT26_000762 [Gymnopilus dilepis]|uniref:F-box domain-containing protein n=1 Tax=Gymnopilus dilepis TaxID=231916 RepID=A0A409Y2H0_9AGAR|nr:LOW QUALITY PROTEIN: hypothetical protein CVT26_000762 [Gymnopilus dilepis]
MFPPEITEEILSHLREDQGTLKSCALTCQSFLFPSRQLLYHKIVLNHRHPASPEKSASRVLALLEVLDANPQLCKHVRHLEIVDQSRRWLVHEDCLDPLLRVLGLLHNLRGLVVNTRAVPRTGFRASHHVDNDDTTMTWPDTLLTAILDIIHLPSLDFVSMTDFPMELMKHCQHVTRLSLWTTSSQPLPSGSCTTCTEKVKAHSLELLEIFCHQDGALDYIQRLRDVVDVEGIRRIYVTGSQETMQGRHLFQKLLVRSADALEKLKVPPNQENHSKHSITHSAALGLRLLPSLCILSSSFGPVDYGQIHGISWEDQKPEHCFKALDQLDRVFEELGSYYTLFEERRFFQGIIKFNDHRKGLSSGKDSGSSNAVELNVELGCAGGTIGCVLGQNGASLEALVNRLAQRPDSQINVKTHLGDTVRISDYSSIDHGGSFRSIFSV